MTTKATRRMMSRKSRIGEVKTHACSWVPHKLEDSNYYRNSCQVVGFRVPNEAPKLRVPEPLERQVPRIHGFEGQ